MQFAKNYLLKNVLKKLSFICLLVVAVFISITSFAQVNMVEFGKNRVQFQKLKWAYYQTDNFNVYYNQHGEGLAKFVAQIAEQELPALEKFAEYALQRRANIIIYNSYDEMQQTNIGLSTDWSTSGGATKLVNNKMVVYYNSDHYNLRKQVKQGIAKTLVDNVLFGDDLGEFAANQALLDLPKWLTDGYIAYAAENWSTVLDDQLKSAMLSGNYKNFYQFAYERPILAGHAFWNFIAENYKKENVTYFLYLSRVYRNTNTAAQRICKKKFKEVLAEFMETEEQKYYKDIRSRRNSPKGSMSVVEDITPYKDFFRFTPNPAPRSQTYAVIEFKRGMQQVVLYENYVNRRVLLKSNIRNVENIPNPNYPLIAWDGKGTRLAVVYYNEGKVQLFVYDILTRIKKNKQAIEGFDQVQDMKFMLNANTLLLSAVKNGQSDIFTYDIEKQKATQITNDVYADVDPSFVAFPNKTGIIYASNRPNATAAGGDTSLPSNNLFNIFLVDNWNKSEYKQISQLSRMRYGNARYPAQYNNAHFTFASDENGIMNRYAGFFTTEKAGVDTIYRIGDEILRNPEYKEIDSLLREYKKSEPDSIFTLSLSNDSAYVFPITNYQSSLTETKASGDNGMVSEVRQEGDLKFLYKLKVDETTLKKRNANPRPTQYRQKLVNETKIAKAEEAIYKDAIDTTRSNDVFEMEFTKDTAAIKRDANGVIEPEAAAPTVLSKSKRFDYKLKFAVDQVTGSLFSNDVLMTRYEPYTGALPLTLNSNGGFNGMIKVTVYDIFEDLRFTGMMRIPLINTAGGISLGGGSGAIGFIPGTQSLFNSGSENLARFDYLKKRVDLNAIYYRKTDVGSDGSGNNPVKSYTNLYQVGVKYPFNKIRSVRISGAFRSDRFVLKGVDRPTLEFSDFVQKYALLHLEYVHDNTIEKATNIMNGLRYKVYADLNQQVGKLPNGETGRSGFNVGFDARYYYPIFQNFIWAGRAAGDASLGNQKILYYLGGADGWLFPKANTGNTPQDPNYAFQSLALNMRGFNQNIANGNNALTLNSEFRFPVFSTLLKRPINNAFLRNFQVVQFFDLGSAWNGEYNGIQRPTTYYPQDDPNAVVRVKIKAGGIGPFVGGYGFGARSTLLGYFLRLDAAWPMDVFFKGKPIFYFSMGIDF
jgi:hypothetical protein